MIKPTKRATVYLDQDLHKFLKIKAAESNRSISDLVNEAIRLELAEELQDLEDLKDSKKREGEPTISYEELLRRLKKDGKI